MIGFDSYSGFLLIFLVPLLILYQRRKSGIREVTVSTYPLLKAQWSRETPHSSPLKLSRKQRIFLISLALICMIMALNGIHLMWNQNKPGEWLMVLDNTYATAGPFEDGTVLDLMKSRIRSLADRIQDEDRFTLITTSPELRVISGLNRSRFLEQLKSLGPAVNSGSPDKVFRFTEAAAKEASFKKVIIVSPRSESLREMISWKTRHIKVPPAEKTLLGNTGFTALESVPLGGGYHSLFLRILSKQTDLDSVDLIISSGNDPPRRQKIDITEDGSGEFLVPGIKLDDQSTALSLDISDNQPGDDTILISGSGSTQKTLIRFPGSKREVLHAALSSYDHFEIVQTDPGKENTPVKIFDTEVPQGQIDSPTLIIFPTSSFDDFKLKRIWAAPIQTVFHPGHPATRHGNMFRDFRPSRIIEFSIPDDFTTLADSQGIPLIFSGKRMDHHVVVWSFNPEDNGLYLDPAFAVMLRDTVAWLGNNEQLDVNYQACLSIHPSSGTARAPGPGPGTRTCSEIVMESASISLPDLSRVSTDNNSRESALRIDLGNAFLLIALILLLILSLDSALGRNA